MFLKKIHIKLIFIIFIIYLIYILINLPFKDSGNFIINKDLYTYSINRNINNEYNLQFCKNMNCIDYNNDNLPDKNTSVRSLFEINFNTKFNLTIEQFNSILKKKILNILFII